MSQAPQHRDSIQVAVAQFAGAPTWEPNLRTCQRFVDTAAAQGADLLVLPEGALRTRNATTDPQSEAQTLDGPFVQALAEETLTHNITVVVGTAERVTDDIDARPYNTAVALQDGQIVAVYRKLHLYDAFTGRESDRLRFGEGPLDTFDVQGFNVGLMTCYDLRFPEAARLLAERGADVIALPTAWVSGPLKEMHWSVLLQARALENTCYIAASGKNGPTRIGRSAIIDPLGVCRAQLGHEDGLLISTVSRDELDAARARLPVLRQRRFRVDPHPIDPADLDTPSIALPQGVNDAE